MIYIILYNIIKSYYLIKLKKKAEIKIIIKINYLINNNVNIFIIIKY